ncbi:MAG: hypothetical protein R6X35_03560 [Candidatus Krumholzibacteriia bacterium]
MHPALIAVLVAAGIGLVVLGWRREEKRRRLLLHWARARGLVRREGKVRGWEQRYPGLKVFQRGHSRGATLVFEGQVDGRPTVCLDYRFVTGSGKNRTTHRRAMVIVETGHPLIPLVIRREHVFDKLGEFLGHDDIDFESAEFSRTFHVSSPDRKWAYDVVHTRTMEYLLQAPPLTVAFGFGEVAVSRPGRLQAKDCEAALKMARRLIELIPDYALQQLKGGRT